MTELLASCTTLRLGGPIGQLLTHTEPGAWPCVARAARSLPLLPLILGGGSNVIAPDDGYPGTVIRIATRGITPRPARDHVDVTVQAGEPLDDLAEFAAIHNLTGIEYLSGIPGTTGAAPIQNTGAYGQQISDTLIAVTAYDWQTSTTVELPASACHLTHRSSVFKVSNRWTVLTVTIRLHHSTQAAPVTYQPLADALGVPLGARPSLTDAVAGVRADRADRGLSLPSNGPDARQIGSAFINPVVTKRQAALISAGEGPIHADQHGRLRASAGWLLQSAGYGPSRRITDGVYCSERRTLTVVARGSASSNAYTRALDHLSADVHRKTGIRLTAEPRILPGTTPRSHHP